MDYAANGRILKAYTSCRYGQMHYRTAGRPRQVSRPPLILLHQNPSSSIEYETFMLAMAEDRLVIAFDTPGNGMSDPPPAPPTMADYAESFSEALTALGLDREGGQVDSFGYHTGTYLAAELGRLRPGFVRRIILSGIPARPAEQRAKLLREAEETPAPSEGGEEIFKHLQWLWSHVVGERDKRVPIARAVDVFGERAKPLVRRAWPYVGVWSYDVAERFPRITQPTLILQAREPLFEVSRASSTLIPNARFVDAAPLSRDIFEVGVDQLAREMRAFLA